MDEAEELSEDYWPFESKNSPEKNLSHALKNVNNSMLGVSGMGGVGKNIFSEKVDRRVIEYLFKVFVEVSETPDLKGILRVRVLLISDDVWNDLDLKTLRISSIVWSLFRKTPGIHLILNVCKERGGLSIVICTIARALKNKANWFE